MTAIRGILFDLDGTLLDTLASIANAFNRSLEKMHFPTHALDSFRYFIGDGVYNTAERCLPIGARTQANIEQLVALQRADYATSWRSNAAPYDGMIELLRQAQAKDFKLAVLSNKDHGFAENCIEHFFPQTQFTCVMGYSNLIPLKPNPTGALAIAELLELSVRQLAIVGDTRMDIETARACNMFSIGVLWGFRGRDELAEAGADRIIQRPAELLPILETVLTGKAQ